MCFTECIYLTLKKLPESFPKWLHVLIFLPAVWDSSRFCTLSPILSVVSLLIKATLAGILQYLVLNLIYIFLMPDGVGHLFLG